MTTTPAMRHCPACKNQTLGVHCATSTCRWHKCRNTDCLCTFDLSAGIGFGKSPHHKRIQLGGAA